MKQSVSNSEQHSATLETSNEMSRNDPDDDQRSSIFTTRARRLAAVATTVESVGEKLRHAVRVYRAKAASERNRR
jgi:cytoskeletal protein RodZ